MIVDDVRAVHARAASEYRARREEAEAAVVTWRWATGPVYGLTPFEPECSHFRRGRPLKTEPKRTAHMDSFGFDCDERLRVVRIGGSRALDQEKFYRWGDAGAVEGVAYSGGGGDEWTLVDLVHVAVYERIEGLVRRRVSVATRGWSVMQFHHVETEVDRIEYQRGGDAQPREYRIVRDSAGDVRRIDGKERMAWEPPPGFKQEWFVRAGERRSSAVAAPVSLR